MKLERVTCVIDRAAHLKIEKSVPAWEVRVLNAVFGKENVIVGRSETYEDDFDAKKEWELMFNRYRTAQNEQAESIFLKVYPNVEALEDAFERVQERAKRKPVEHRASA